MFGGPQDNFQADDALGGPIKLSIWSCDLLEQVIQSKIREGKRYIGHSPDEASRVLQQ